jgi:hypothetical protein
MWDHATPGKVVHRVAIDTQEHGGVVGRHDITRLILVDG